MLTNHVAVLGSQILSMNKSSQNLYMSGKKQTISKLQYLRAKDRNKAKKEVLELR